MNDYLEVLKKYAVFDGRARRREYWMFVLFNIIVSIVLGVLDGILGLKSQQGAGVLGGLYSLAVIIPSIAVGVRRLHDTGRSGWMMLVGLIPCLGGLILLYWMILDSGPDNEYGPNPKAKG